MRNKGWGVLAESLIQRFARKKTVLTLHGEQKKDGIEGLHL